MQNLFDSDQLYQYGISNPLALNLYTYVLNNSINSADPEGLFGLFGPGVINVRPDKQYTPTADDIAKLPWEKTRFGKAIPGQFGTAGLIPVVKLAPEVAKTGVALLRTVEYGVPIPIYFEDLMKNILFPRPETSVCDN